MTAPRYTKLVASLPSTVPFVGPETQERARGLKFAARLGANENVFGPSPKAIAAMQAAVPDVWMYGDPENHDLKRALAAFHGIKPENIVVGAGIDGLLGSLSRMLVGGETPVVTSLGAYPTFNFHVAGYGGALHTVPYQGDFEDPSALLDKAREVDAALMYFANPDNPMGTWHDADAMQEMIDNVPDGTVLCLDEAYLEFAPEGTAPALDTDNRNVIRMRTFSKAYGMAGARVGYAIGHADLINSFNKVRNHFGMNRASQAGALAALEDQQYLAQTLADIADSKQRIGTIVRKYGFEPIPSATNFVTIDCGKDGDYARALVAALIAQNIFVRMPFVAPQDRCIRVSAGRPQDIDLFEVALPLALETLK
ncbi:MAG: pyridoxal phosphate-dependent aminotransferase [Rhodobacteraceae bacterium]|nr:pyridoxal phosphate-dependent aminotransferase [Paracoccaceae bacterium]